MGMRSDSPRVAAANEARRASLLNNSGASLNNGVAAVVGSGANIIVSHNGGSNKRDSTDYKVGFGTF